MSGNRKLLILIYHSILTKHDHLRPGDTHINDFIMQMKVISKYFSPVRLGDAIGGLYSGNLPARAVCITFDDGYADNYNVALPVLKKFNVPATFFVATAYLNTGIMWNDAIIESVRLAGHNNKILDLSELEMGIYPVSSGSEQYNTVSALLRKLKYLPFHERQLTTEKIAKITNTSLPTDLMMTIEQVRELYENNMEIGGHTANHPILQTLSKEEAKSEIQAGKELLENVIGEKLKVFAYPNGRPEEDYNPTHADIVKDMGFVGAVSTQRGIATKTSRQYELPRYNVWDNKQWKFILRLLKEHYFSAE